MTPGSRSRLAPWVALALLLALTALAFAPLAHYPFIIYDDGVYVSGNNHVAEGLTWANLRWALTTNQVANWHPVTWLSHMLDVQLFGFDAGRHHLVSLLLHLANTVLLFVILRAMTGAPWGSLTAAALFALHPIHVESVVWVAERKDVLSAFFLLLALFGWLRYVARPAAWRYLLVGLAFALGLMSKAMVVTFPLLLLLLDFWPLGRLGARSAGGLGTRGAARGPGLRGVLLEKVPFFLLSAASSITGYIVLRNYGVITSATTFPLGARLGNALVAYAVYLRKTVWPADLGLLLFEPPRALAWETVLPAALVVIVATVGAVLAARRLPWVTVGWCWYLVALLPVSGLVHAGGLSLADRYTYLPLIGVFLAAVWLGGKLLPRSRAGRAAAICIGLLLPIGLVPLARKQVGYWRDSAAVLERAVATSPDNATGHLALADRLMRLKDYPGAERHYREALRVDPTAVETRNNFGWMLLEQGRYDDAINEFAAAVRIDPGYARARGNLKLALEKKNAKTPPP